MFSFTEYFSTKVYGRNAEQANIYFDSIQLEYVKRFEERTRQHIARVIENGLILYQKFDLPHIFMEQVYQHDRSKFYSEEMEGYIWTNAKYNLGIPYPSKEIEELAKKSWENHYTHNNHHPEYFVNPNVMSEIHVAHMCADWYAMSEEFGNDAMTYYKTKLKNKFNFDSTHEEMIFKFLTYLKEKKNEDV